MSVRGIVDMVQISIDVPRGEAGYWSIIRDLDVGGPWTVRQICDRTNVSTSLVGRYVRRLKLAGIAQIVETRTACNVGGGNLPAAVIYRLAKRPLLAPRISPDGKVRPELGIEQLWRAMKMAKVFSPADLAEHCPDVAPGTVKAYLQALSAAGIVAGTPAAYRLVRNLGLQAPKILATKLVYDPNKKVVVGPSITFEVKP
ncbi:MULTISPECIES: hypothetical protein [unclassified Mesorhizobium]|uniref:hypothetical protein n=1 Tax=unclassified Mesorhizobium TaxID=325217 RepID=UPI0003CF343D|nr:MULTISPECIES: hypothetical protein [unclassified Mesorhizobium]ESY48983.1 hypothetical protein X745_27800 [Mesorhizobium sp. LNJC374B00]ESY52779.1 hypothetical protein X744_28800 [Mesorhizobium sp. LNJC372A00]WJI81500.1 hypothetical protein NLY34_01685 [Mesorhizobium sp. C374B]WJI88019.1 hypothetical protein NLY42_04100 [Mesorhizobium sp. C372A]